MKPINDLNHQERAIFALRALYRSYGYTPYKMSKFEEYDLYARNKDFLPSSGIITFTDTDGRLLALKPDVTLSIIKNGQDAPGVVQKTYYNENVYRVSGGHGDFREIMQVGLECIGDVDLYCLSEVLTLAAESLRTVSREAVLVLSHQGLLSILLEDLHLNGQTEKEVLRCAGEKNLHELSRLLADAAVDEARAARVLTLLSTDGEPDEVLARLYPLASELPAFGAAIHELSAVLDTLRSQPFYSMLRLDFSVTGNSKYYDGIIFCGYIGGIPQSVLSGGEYGRLMRRMGRASRAVGFAVYLDQLELLPTEEERYDADVLLLYEKNCDLSALIRARAALAADGSAVVAARKIPEKGRYRKILQLKGSEVTALEDRA